MIRDSEGRYWLESMDEDGRRRSSYLGNIGRPGAVELWCLHKGIDFRQVQIRPVRPEDYRQVTSSAGRQCEDACRVARGGPLPSATRLHPKGS